MDAMIVSPPNVRKCLALLETDAMQSGVLDIKNQSFVIPAKAGIHDSDLTSINGFPIKAFGNGVIFVLRNFS